MSAGASHRLGACTYSGTTCDRGAAAATEPKLGFPTVTECRVCGTPPDERGASSSAVGRRRCGRSSRRADALVLPLCQTGGGWQMVSHSASGITLAYPPEWDVQKSVVTAGESGRAFSSRTSRDTGCGTFRSSMAAPTSGTSPVCPHATSWWMSRCSHVRPLGGTSATHLCRFSSRASSVIRTATASSASGPASSREDEDAVARLIGSIELGRRSSS